MSSLLTPSSPNTDTAELAAAAIPEPPGADDPSGSIPVNYDEDALVEVTVGDVDFRLDSGKAGTALCISQRETGTWRWQFIGEAKWDGRTLRTRALERSLLDDLGRELRAVTSGQDEA